MLQRPGLPLLCLFIAPHLVSAVVASKNTAGSVTSVRARTANGAAAHFDPMGLGLGDAGDLPALEDNSRSDMISVPGEGAIEDEMAALQRPTPTRPPAVAYSGEPKPQKSLLALSKAQANGLMLGASPVSGFFDTPARTIPSAPSAPKPKVLEEYDVVDDDENDDYRTTKMEEASTPEELERVRRGDVEHVKPTERKKPKLLVRRASLAAAVQEHSKVDVHEAHSEAQEQAPGNAKMMSQCMTFAGWVKSQGSTGPDLVRIWKGTCMPAVLAGDAPPAYGNMCNALGTAVSQFSVRPWAPKDMCQAVMQVFHESGVGATPLF